MARAQFNPGELDQNFKIEDGIRRTLSSDPTASVRVSVIELCYDALDADGSRIPTATLNDKCQQIANALGVDYSIRETLVVFRRTRSTS
jgi:hypothetical protein